jgi:hypothetical protein
MMLKCVYNNVDSIDLKSVLYHAKVSKKVEEEVVVTIVSFVLNWIGSELSLGLYCTMTDEICTVALCDYKKTEAKTVEANTTVLYQRKDQASKWHSFFFPLSKQRQEVRIKTRWRRREMRVLGRRRRRIFNL